MKKKKSTTKERQKTMHARQMTRDEFLDVRNHGFVRVAVVVPRVHLGSPAKNVEAHLAELEKVYRKGAQYALCPELGLAAYTCKDAFFHKILADGALEALKELCEKTRSWNMIITVGLPMVVDRLLVNCAVTMYRGEVLQATGKLFPPNDGEFEELRYFSSTLDTRSKTIRLFGREIPYGPDVMVCSEDDSSFALYVDICQDGWVPVPEANFAALSGATILANTSASTAVIAKDDYRRMLFTVSSGINHAVRMYASAGFGESTQDVSWDGHAMIAERGSLLAETELFQIEGTHAITDVNLLACASSRQQDKSFGQNARLYGRDFRRVYFSGRLGIDDATVYHQFARKIDPSPFVPSDPRERDKRCKYTYNCLVTGVARHLLTLPEHMRKTVLGLSGGLDSTNAILVLCRAMDLLGLPRKNVIAITMPGFGTTDRTYQNACKLARALGVTFIEIPITPVVLKIFEDVGHNPDDENLVFENVQAWTRKVFELAIACKENGIDINTSDLSEAMLGWCTMFGDHAGHYGVNSGVAKTLMKYLVRWQAEVVFKDEPETSSSLLDILDTPVSPELKRHKDGKIVQKTEENIGPYDLHDFYIPYFKRFGEPPSVIARLAYEAWSATYPLVEIKKWLGVFLKRFFQSQVKRSVLPLGVKVGSVAVSPRGDLRWTVGMLPNIWLEDLARVPDTLD